MRSMTFLTRHALVLVAATVAGCGSGNSSAPDMAMSMCFTNPMKHVEIINACTDAVAIDKPATLAKFKAGAPLMPLP